MIAVTLGELLHRGDISIAAIIDTTIHCHVAAGSAVVHGHRIPAAVLVRYRTATVAFDPDGRLIAADELDRRYQSERKEFERIVAERDATQPIDREPDG